MTFFSYSYYFGTTVLFGGLFYLNIGHVAHHGSNVTELHDVIPHVIVGFVVTVIGLAIMVVANRKSCIENSKV